MRAICVLRLSCAHDSGASFFHRQMKPASSEPRYVLSTDTFGEVVKMMAELNMGHIWVRIHRARFSLHMYMYCIYQGLCRTMLHSGGSGFNLDETYNRRVETRFVHMNP